MASICSAGKVVRINFFIPFIFIFGFQAHSQSAPPSEITFSCKECTMKLALDRFSNATGLLFSYKAGLFDEDSIITIYRNSVTVDSLLSVLLPENLTWKTLNNYVIIKGKNGDSKKIRSKYVIEGTIYDALTGETIHGVTIYDREKLKSTFSNNRGHFEMTVSSEMDYLPILISRQFYKDTIIIIRPGEFSSLKVELSPRYGSVKKIAPSQVEFRDNVEDIRFVKIFVPESQFRSALNVKSIYDKGFQISVLPFLGSNGLLGGSIRSNFSFNVLSGYNYEIQGGEIGGVLNIVRNDVLGFQLSGGGNIVGGKVAGIQIAGVHNNVLKSFYGIQFGGFSNLVLDSMEGFQTAGFSNIIRGSFKGIQIGGFHNLVTKDIRGGQLSGFSNIAVERAGNFQVGGFLNIARSLNGLQASGFMNITGQRSNGLQVSGFLNYAKYQNGLQAAGFLNISSTTSNGVQVAPFMNFSSSIDGLQISPLFNISSQRVRGGQIGLLNIGKEIKGFQLGLFNLSDTLTGIPLGLFSFSWKGYREIEFSWNDAIISNFAFKTGVRKFYNIYSLGFKPREEHDVFTAGFGYGADFKLSKTFSLSTDLIFRWVYRSDTLPGMNEFLHSLNLNINAHFGEFILFVGPQVHLHQLNNIKEPEEFYLSELEEKNIFFETDFFHGMLSWAWPGFQAGFRF